MFLTKFLYICNNNIAGTYQVMKYDKLNIKKEELKVRDKNTIISGARVECLGNRPFFSCVVSCQAFDWE